MSENYQVTQLKAREILDSRGFPTIECECTIKAPTGRVSTGRAAVPSGASTGEGEALELRDGNSKRYAGKGVLKAVENVRGPITSALLKASSLNLAKLDSLMCELDGTETKSKLGANAILSVSMAFARAVAEAESRSLFKSLAPLYPYASPLLPVPLMNVINGGKHADNSLNLQEFMLVPMGFSQFKDALRAGAEVFHALKKILHDGHLSTAVGDEGGFAPEFKSANPHTEALEVLIKAIEKAGYRAGEQISLALDSASSEFYSGGTYHFEGKKLSSEEMISVYDGWAKKFPIISIEDGLAESDWDGWKKFTTSHGSKLQLVGDDLFCTNPKVLKEGIEKQTANSILIKVNQIGSLTETVEAMKMANSAGYTAVVSHRSGETEDTFIADLAVASGAGQIKTGSLSRTDRIAKYNQLLRIEEELGQQARYAGSVIFKKWSKSS